jgi:hypothetical protein
LTRRDGDRRDRCDRHKHGQDHNQHTHF